MIMLKKVNKIIRYYDKGVKFYQEQVDEFIEEATELLCEIYKVNYNSNIIIDNPEHKIFIEKYTIELAKKQLALLCGRFGSYTKEIEPKYSRDKLLKKTITKMRKLVENLDFEAHLHSFDGFTDCPKCGEDYDTLGKEETKQVKADFGDGMIAAGYADDTLVTICPSCTKIHNEFGKL